MTPKPSLQQVRDIAEGKQRAIDNMRRLSNDIRSLKPLPALTPELTALYQIAEALSVILERLP